MKADHIQNHREIVLYIKSERGAQPLAKYIKADISRGYPITIEYTAVRQKDPKTTG